MADTSWCGCIRPCACLCAVRTIAFSALLASLLVRAVGLPACNTSDYATVYGGVAARDVTHLHELLEKELLVYQLTQRLALTQFQSACNRTTSFSGCGAEVEPVVLSYQKQRLYVSEANGCPLKWVYLTEEAGYVQRRTQEAVLGNLFKVSNGFTPEPIGDLENFELGFEMPEPRQCNVIHNFTLTKTLTKEYFIYSHTWMDVSQMMNIRSSPDCHGNLTIATQNIWHFSHAEGSRYTDRIKELGTVIHNLKADIIAFQEVRLDTSWSKPSQVAHLQYFLQGYQYVFQPAMLDPGHGMDRVEEGLAIFTRHAITEWSYILLTWNHSDPEDTHQRILLHASVDTPQFGQVHVFTTHLSLSESARKRSVVEVCRYMNRYSGPKFLMGDFNSIPYSEEMAYLRGEVPLEGTYCRDLTDVWRESPQYRNMATKPSDRAGLTFSAIEDNPTKRIDYIFMSSRPLHGDCKLRVNAMEVVGTLQSGPRAVSDHFGLHSVISATSTRRP